MENNRIGIRSLNKSQQEIINDILYLHCPQGFIDLDCTYSKGVFYKNGKVGEPVLKTDKFPQTEDTIRAESSDLPFESESMNCIMFDPPFIISGKTYKDNKEGSSIIAKRFSAYENYEELKTHYSSTLKELHRILKDKGIVIIKLQNTVSSGKQHMTHYFVCKTALKLGYYIKDEFILEATSKMTSFGSRWKTQKHALKYHSYFLVLQKNGKMVDYD